MSKSSTLMVPRLIVCSCFMYVGFRLELYFVNFCTQVAEDERAGCFDLILFVLSADGMRFDVPFSRYHELVCYCGIS